MENLCPKCKHTLQRKKDKLWCSWCGNEERIIIEPNPSSEFVSVEDIIK